MWHYKDLLAFKKSYELAMEIFVITKKFPNEEKYSLIDQVRRSLKPVCKNDEVGKLVWHMINNPDKFR